MLEKGQEGRHFKICEKRKVRVHAEKLQRAKDARDKRKSEGKVSYLRKLPEKEEMTFMEPMLNGDYQPYQIEKFPWKCKICGLVWQTREDAERCPLLTENPFVHAKPPHAPVYQRMYGVRYVENGVPRGNPYTIDFKAMRKEEPEPLPEGKKWDIPDVKPVGHEDVRTLDKKLRQREFEELRALAEAGENPDPDVSEMNLSTAEMDEGDYP